MAWNSRTNNKPEKEIEEYLVERIKDLGGMCPKWNSPGTKGVPDRIVLMPNSMICFVRDKKRKRAEEYRRCRSGEPSSLSSTVL